MRLHAIVYFSAEFRKKLASNLPTFRCADTRVLALLNYQKRGPPGRSRASVDIAPVAGDRETTAIASPPSLGIAVSLMPSLSAIGTPERGVTPRRGGSDGTPILGPAAGGLAAAAHDAHGGSAIFTLPHTSMPLASAAAAGGTGRSQRAFDFTRDNVVVARSARQSGASFSDADDEAHGHGAQFTIRDARASGASAASISAPPTLPPLRGARRSDCNDAGAPGAGRADPGRRESQAGSIRRESAASSCVPLPLPQLRSSRRSELDEHISSDAARGASHHADERIGDGATGASGGAPLAAEMRTEVERSVTPRREDRVVSTDITL